MISLIRFTSNTLGRTIFLHNSRLELLQNVGQVRNVGHAKWLSIRGLNIKNDMANSSLILNCKSKTSTAITRPLARYLSGKSEPNAEQPVSLIKILEHEIQEETSELNQHLSTDQFPGFSVETEDSDVKLIKQVDDATVAVRFSVSSSLNEWPGEPSESNQQQPEDASSSLVSMPEFQVQISKNNQTLELSCYFEEMDRDEETGESNTYDPIFNIDEVVIYEGEPKETEFAVNAEYFQEEMQAGLFQFLAKYGIDEEFAKNLVSFATGYEKKQYISFMRRLKNFVA